MTDNPETYLDEVTAEGSERRLQVVRAGSRYFGIPTDEISTIVVWREPTPLPYAPQSVLGVVSIEGRMLTVMDLAKLTAGQADVTHAEARVNAERGGHVIALRGDEQLALAVDEVGEMIPFREADSVIQQQEIRTTIVVGVFQRDEMEINILNLKELFPTAIQGRERRRRRF
ncbi:MAG TPA: chemotaxis protein CheW [Pyrinomonadaceae bacterium]|nr:chemotaxis protein CheW [Pyrinomonadaceae bacterium]